MVSLHSQLHAIAFHGVRALRRGPSLNRLYHADSGVSATHDDQSTLGALDMQQTREGKCTIMLIN